MLNTLLKRYSKAEYVLNVDELIGRLLGSRYNKERVALSENECKAVAIVIRGEYTSTSPLINIKAPIKVIGDLHGQFIDLLRIFEMCGNIPQNRYLFLGDYVDRGRKSLEVIMLLFLYKIKYPEKIYLLRGNHESERISKSYGFLQEIKERFNSNKIWKMFIKTFKMMPMCAIIENSIFCCHGGLSPEFLYTKHKNMISVFSNYKLPEEIGYEGLLCDLVWADPMEIGNNGKEPLGWISNKRGCSWNFGYDVIKEFLDKFNLDLIVRGHQVVEDGYEFYGDRTLVTLFSAPRYCGEFDNAGGIFEVEMIENENKISVVEGSFKILKPDYNLQHQWIRNLKLKSIRK